MKLHWVGNFFRLKMTAKNFGGLKNLHPINVPNEMMLSQQKSQVMLLFR